jgi:plastocyanin
MTAIAMTVALVAQGCGTVFGNASSTRRVLVDFNYDQFAASFFDYFPSVVKVHPGDTVEFRQFWTGEPHSVTMGTLVDTLGKPYWDILDKVRRGEKVDIPEAEPDAPGFDALPVFFDEASANVNQAGAQPCYRDQWAPAEQDASKRTEPCPQRAQPKFDGRQAYYSSGFIPYQGLGSNSFKLPLADDVLPGTYHYYCTLHSILMSGEVDVVAKSQPIPSQTDANKAASKQAKQLTDVLGRALERVRAGGGQPLPAVGGYPKDDELPIPGLFEANLDEFVPSTVNAKVGEKVTWTFYNGHTLSFNVPRYFPVFRTRKDGTVFYDHQGVDPVKWPGRPKPPEGSEESHDGPPPAPAHVDAGSWDGSGGLHSTGWDFGEGDTFSVAFTRAGTYPFACLIHPAMVGKVVVT